MGRVYRARDARLGREVAIKVLGEHHAGSPEFVERFGREVRSVASLDHPNVVRVFDSGEDDDGSPYMAMELVDGGTLKDKIRHDGPLPPHRAARVAFQVAEALGAAHAAGIVHRDVKPENVLLTKDGRVKVADFGIARATEATAMTRTSMILGTAPYLSPEQARGEPVGPASDLYSLGVVLYEALTGRTPFGTGEHANPLAIAMKHCTEPAPSPRAANREVPRPLELVTLALMRKRPAERYAGATALADDLAAFLRGEGLSSTAATRLGSPSEEARTRALRRAPTALSHRGRRKKVLPVTAVVAVALASILALAFSPLVPMQRPVAFVEGTVAPDTGGLDRAVSPTLGGRLGAPDPPERERPDAPREVAREQDPGPRDPIEPRPDVAAEPATLPATPEETDPGGASAGASASASASAAAATSTASPSMPSNSYPAAGDASAAPEQAPEHAPEPASPSSAPAAGEALEPVAEPTPTSPASASEPAPSPPVPAPAASAPAGDERVRIPGAQVSGPEPAPPPPASARRSPTSEPPEVSAPVPELAEPERAAEPQRAPASQPSPSAFASGSAPPGASPAFAPQSARRHP